MMTKNKDGGPAFPASRYEKRTQMQPDGAVGIVTVKVDHPGMTLRDWFAGQALAGWLASYGDSTPHPIADADQGAKTAEQAYRMADAMLAARAKGNPS